MTYSEIQKSSKDMLTPTDIAEVLGVMPYSINVQAKADITKLGFPAAMIGTRVMIPRIGFLRWLEGSDR